MLESMCVRGSRYTAHSVGRRRIDLGTERSRSARRSAVNLCSGRVRARARIDFVRVRFVSLALALAGWFAQYTANSVGRMKSDSVAGVRATVRPRTTEVSE